MSSSAPHTLHSRARALARRHSARVPLTPTRTNLHGARTARTPTRPARTVASHTRIMGPDARHIKQPTTPGTAGHNARNCGTAVSGVVTLARASVRRSSSIAASFPSCGRPRGCISWRSAGRAAYTLSHAHIRTVPDGSLPRPRPHQRLPAPHRPLAHGGTPRGAPHPRSHDPACLPACQQHRTALIPCPRSVF